RTTSAGEYEVLRTGALARCELTAACGSTTTCCGVRPLAKNHPHDPARRISNPTMMMFLCIDLSMEAPYKESYHGSNDELRIGAQRACSFRLLTIGQTPVSVLIEGEPIVHRIISLALVAVA